MLLVRHRVVLKSPGYDNRGGLMTSALEGGRVVLVQMLVVVTTLCSWDADSEDLRDLPASSVA